MSERVVVTGSSGYIGGQTTIRLKELGYHVIGIDVQSCPQRLRSYQDRSFQEDYASRFALDLIADSQPLAIIHCAGTSLVGPSLLDPERYYNNNFVKTKRLMDHVRVRVPKTRMVFSSSAAVYGEPVMTPCHEVDPTLPISPYGESKLMIEMLLQAYQRAYGTDFVALRYFNAAGADPKGRHGQNPAATHLVARVLEASLNQSMFTLNGNDYPTPDGTCIRDYIHVDDLADAHVRAMLPETAPGIYNLGTNSGHSNLEVIDTARKITGIELTVAQGPARVGDPAQLTANSEKFRLATDWKPKWTLEDIIAHAWRWYRDGV
jgi:UDP-glucose 4-epimerase